MRPLVSVIIPNYNYASYVGKAIDSVLGQTYSNTEIIVVDDGSSDGSLDVLRQFGDRIKVIEQKNQGVSMARNNGVAASTGEYVAFLDADDIWLPEKLEKQMRIFDSDTEVGLVHCPMIYIDKDDHELSQSEEGMEGWVATEFLRFDRGVVLGAGSTAVTPKTVFEEVGGFDRRQTTAADWDFSYRVASKYKVGLVADPHVLYRQHGTNMHGNIRAMEHDMLLGYKKAFAEDKGLEPIKAECYGKLYSVLSGSYFQAGDYGGFLKNAAKSIWQRPSNLGYFLKFPLRRRQRVGRENAG